MSNGFPDISPDGRTHWQSQIQYPPGKIFRWWIKNEWVHGNVLSISNTNYVGLYIATYKQVFIALPKILIFSINIHIINLIVHSNPCFWVVFLFQFCSVHRAVKKWNIYTSHDKKLTKTINKELTTILTIRYFFTLKCLYII